jgi:hypothetical protein
MNAKEQASSLVNNYLYFCGSREKAISCALYSVELFIGHLDGSEDNLLNFYRQVKKELYQLNG